MIDSVKIRANASHTALPIEEKESIRWLDSMRKTISHFKGQNKKVVTIADREADIYDMFLLADRINANCINSCFS